MHRLGGDCRRCVDQHGFLGLNMDRLVCLIPTNRLNLLESIESTQITTMDLANENGDSNKIFSIEPVQLQFQFNSDIQNLLVSNNILYLVLINGNVFRIDLNNPEKIDHLSPFNQRSNHNNSNEYITNSYLDPMGYHLFLQTSKNELFYANIDSTNFTSLSKFSKLSISTMFFFNELITRQQTGPVLIGSSSGILYETLIESTSKSESYLKQVFKTTHSIDNICGTYYHEDNNVNGNRTQESKDFKLVLTSNNKLVYFKLNLDFKPNTSTSNLYSSFKKQQPTFQNFNEIKSFGFNSKTLSFTNIDKLTFAKINHKGKDLINFKLDIEEEIKCILPTKYHILLLCNNKIIYYNQLDGEKGTIHLPEDNDFIGITSDDLYETFWLYSTQNLYEIIVDNENSNIWKTMVNQNLFDDALALLKPSDSINRDHVLIAKGNYLLDAKQEYEESARVLGLTSESFEKISLKYLDQKQDRALIIYLTTKMNKLLKSQYMQRRMLSSWIVQLYVQRLNELESVTEADNNSKGTTDNSANDFQKVKDEFKNFLAKYHENDFIDKETVYQILLSNNRKEELLDYCNIIKDDDFVLKYYINLQKWKDALKVLLNQKNPVLIYKYSTVLLINYSQKTVEAWLRIIGELDVTKLLPAILTYDKCYASRVSPDYHQGIIFLRTYIKETKCKTQIVHNTLLSLLIRYPNIPNDNLVLKYFESNYVGFRNGDGVLNSSRRRGNVDSSDILFDTDYILRLCFKYNKMQVIIYIYSMIGKFEDAVKLALDHDLIEVAIFVAEKPMDDDKERKKLWLQISKKLIHKVVTDDKFLEENKMAFTLEDINENGDGEGKGEDEDDDDDDDNRVKQLIRFLLFKCDLLTIRDLLPLFPDTIVIDNFKKEIVDLLETLNNKMNKLSNEMTQSIKMNYSINSQIKNYKDDSYQIIEPHESCNLCSKILVTRKFLIYPCMHSFHQDCIVKEILNSNDYKLKNKIYVLQKKLGLNRGNHALINELKNEIDELLTSKCCLCSDLKINSIDMPLVSNDDHPGDWDL